MDADLSALSIPNTVITSLDREPGDDTYALSSVQTTQTSGFDLSHQSVAATGLQVLATQLGQQSRVVTVGSFDAAGQTVVLSYGGQADTTTVYESKTVTMTLTTVGTDATNLAAAGYLITALGGNPTNGLVLVGTRVQGDSMPRPRIVVIPIRGLDLTSLFTGGDAIVGYVFRASAGVHIYIGEQ